MDPETETMDVEDQNEARADKTETKLPFSIENLLSDKFNKEAKQNTSADDINPEFADYTRRYIEGVYDDRVGNNEVDSGEVSDDEKSDDVDVESAGADAQELEKAADYQQSGNHLQLQIHVIQSFCPNKDNLFDKKTNMAQTRKKRGGFGIKVVFVDDFLNFCCKRKKMTFN